MQKIKILYVLNTLCVGGIENSVISLCNSLDNSKYDITLLILSNNHNELEYKLRPYINVITLPLKHRAISVIDTAILCLWIPKLISIFRRVRPDIIHTNIYQYNSIPVLKAMHWSRTKTLHFHTIHSTGLHYENKTRSHSIKLNIEKYYYIKSKTNLVCVSNDVERNVIKYLNGYNQQRVIANGFDGAVFDPLKFQRPESDEALSLIYVSRLVDGKNHITLLRAMVELIKKYKDIRLTLVGDGDLRGELERFVYENQLSDNVEFLGSRNNVAQLLGGSDIGVFPSEYEGFSIALVEMMAMRLAVVCSDILNFRDLSKAEGDILFFDVFDYRALMSQIERLYLDREFLRAQKQKAYDLSREYQIENIVSKYDDYYTATIENN